MVTWKRERREAENDDHPFCLSEVHQNLKSIHEDGNLNAPFECPHGENKLSWELLEEIQRIKDLTGEITSPQTEEPYLHFENSRLESEIQKLQLKLQIRPELHEEHDMQMEKRSIWKETHYLEIGKKLLKVSRSLNSTCQTCNLYKKMAEDMGRKLERTTSFCQKEILL